jgi:hypothetical protein
MVKVNKPKTAVNSPQLLNKVNMTKIRKRKRKNNMQVVPYVSNTSYPMVQAPGTSNGGFKSSKRLPSLLRNPKLTEDGLNFLKCAFAPPDFTTVNVRGVPDSFEGVSLVKKHRYINTLSFAAGVDYWFCLAPVPGASVFVTSTLAGILPTNTSQWEAVPYNDALQMFGIPNGESAADIVNSFRFVSNHIEIIPTTNQATWTGSIQSWKVDLKTMVRNEAVTNLYGLTGLQSCLSTISNRYSGPFNLGLYAGSYSDSKFLFQPVVEKQTRIPNAIAPGDWGQLFMTGMCCPGMDNNFGSTIVKISGMTGPNSCIIKTWACVEYTCLANSSLYEYQTISPCDPLALEVYKKVIHDLPPGVSFLDNERFWLRVLGIINRVSGVLSILPGPYGMAAGGVNQISTALRDLVM